MKKFPAVFVMVFITIVFFGCNLDGDDGFVEMSLDSLAGTWVSEYNEKFNFAQSPDTLSYHSPDWFAVGTPVVEWFSSKVQEVWGFKADPNSGLIFIEYTSKRNDWGTSSSGNFTVVYFTNLSSSSVELSNASSNNVTPTFFTLASAKEVFTIHTVSTYFAFTSICEKQ